MFKASLFYKLRKNSLFSQLYEDVSSKMLKMFSVSLKTQVYTSHKLCYFLHGYYNITYILLWFLYNLIRARARVCGHA